MSIDPASTVYVATRTDGVQFHVVGVFHDLDALQIALGAHITLLMEDGRYDVEPVLWREHDDGYRLYITDQTGDFERPVSYTVRPHRVDCIADVYAPRRKSAA